MNRQKRIDEIGGDFSLNNLENVAPNKQWNQELFGEANVLVDSGRSAFKYLLKSLKFKQTILLPAYLCSSILSPLNEAGINYEFYKIKGDFSIDVNDLKNRITRETGLVYIIKYFGFEFNRDEEEFICNTSKPLVLDLSHSLIDKIEFPAYIIGSLRKILPVPDGGICFGLKMKKGIEIEDSNNNGVLHLRLEAMCLKNLYLQNAQVGKTQYMKLFNEAEELLSRQTKIFGISAVSQAFLEFANLANIKNIRMNNFFCLLKGIGNKGVNKRVKRSNMLYKFPLLVEPKKREKILSILIKNKVYVSKHWEYIQALDKNVYKGAWEISRRMVTIPIDQRYSENDMKRIVALVKKHV